MTSHITVHQEKKCQSAHVTYETLAHQFLLCLHETLTNQVKLFIWGPGDTVDRSKSILCFGKGKTPSVLVHEPISSNVTYETQPIIFVCYICYTNRFS